VTFQRDVVEHSRFGQARRYYLKWKNRLLRLLKKPEIDDSYPDAVYHSMLPVHWICLILPIFRLKLLFVEGWRYLPPVTDKPDIICFSIIDWNHLTQRPQQLMTRFAAEGHRIFWIDVALRTERSSDYRNLPCAQLAPNIYYVQLPGPVGLVYYLDLEGAVLMAMEEAFDGIRLTHAIDCAVCFVNFPGWAPLAYRLRDRFGWKIGYDCLDDQEEFARFTISRIAILNLT